MAFTAWELIRGAIVAWVTFLMIAPALNVIVIYVSSAFWSSGEESNLPPTLSPGFLLFASALSALTLFLPWSFGAIVALGLPSAYLLGFGLRKTSAVSTHLLAFAGLGALVGAATTLVAAQVIEGELFTGESLSALVVNVAATASSVALGWRFTAKRALRADARTRAEYALPTAP